MRPEPRKTPQKRKPPKPARPADVSTSTTMKPTRMCYTNSTCGTNTVVSGYAALALFSPRQQKQDLGKKTRFPLASSNHMHRLRCHEHLAPLGRSPKLKLFVYLFISSIQASFARSSLTLSIVPHSGVPGIAIGAVTYLNITFARKGRKR